MPRYDRDAHLGRTLDDGTGDVVGDDTLERVQRWQRRTHDQRGVGQQLRQHAHAEVEVRVGPADMHGVERLFGCREP